MSDWKAPSLSLKYPFKRGAYLCNKSLEFLVSEGFELKSEVGFGKGIMKYCYYKEVSCRTSSEEKIAHVCVNHKGIFVIFENPLLEDKFELIFDNAKDYMNAFSEIYDQMVKKVFLK